MGRLLRRHGVRGEVAQASFFHNRQRRLSLLDPTAELFRTHVFSAASDNILTGTLFPVRSTPLSISFEIVRGAGTPSGIILELGDSTTGLAIWAAGADIGFAAGQGTGDAGLGGVAEDVLPSEGARVRIAATVVPGMSAIRIWANGTLKFRADGDPMTSGWASSASGAVGEVNGTVTPRAGTSANLANCTIIGLVSAYAGQRPRQLL